jgi:YHS domain-containing protein
VETQVPEEVNKKQKKKGRKKKKSQKAPGTLTLLTGQTFFFVSQLLYTAFRLPPQNFVYLNSSDSSFLIIQFPLCHSFLFLTLLARPF